jgi:hypothetical protein
MERASGQPRPFARAETIAGDLATALIEVPVKDVSCAAEPVNYSSQVSKVVRSETVGYGN